MEHRFSKRSETQIGSLPAAVQDHARALVARLAEHPDLFTRNISRGVRLHDGSAIIDGATYYFAIRFDYVMGESRAAFVGIVDVQYVPMPGPH